MECKYTPPAEQSNGASEAPEQSHGTPEETGPTQQGEGTTEETLTLDKSAILSVSTDQELPADIFASEGGGSTGVDENRDAGVEQ